MAAMRAFPWIWLLLLVLIAQLLVPAIALLQERKPVRFGFQMYSGYGEGEITVLDAAGAELDVDLSALLPRSLRPELDWTMHVPEHFCSEVPGAATIVVQQDFAQTVSVPCG